MRRLRVFSLFSLFFVFLLIFVSCVGAWYSGSWDVESEDYWHIDFENGDVEGVANYNWTIIDFTGYSLNWTMDEFNARESLLFGLIKTTYCQWNYAVGFMGDNGEVVWTNGLFSRSRGWAGSAVPTQGYGVANMWFDAGYCSANTGANVNGTFFVSKNSTDELIFSFYTQDWDYSKYFDGDYMVNLPIPNVDMVNKIIVTESWTNVTVNVGADWFGDVKVMLYVGWQYEPLFEIHGDSLFYNSTSPVVLPHLDEDGSPLLPPSGRDDIFSLFFGSVGMLMSIIGSFLTFIWMILPYTPHLLAVFFFTAIIACFRARSMEPLWTVFNGVYDVAMGVYSALSGVAMAIYDVVTGPFG